MNEQLIKDVLRWIITTKNTEMLDESDIDMVYKDYVNEKASMCDSEHIAPVVRLLPCPFCGRQPKEYWDYKSSEDETYNEGYNITCCVVHITAIYKEEAVEHWNTRQ